MKHNPAFFMLVILVLILSACATTPNQAPEGPPVAMATSRPAALPASDSGGKSSTGLDTQQPASITNMVIKNAELTIVVADPVDGMTTIMEMANQMKGYVVSSKSFKITTQNGVEVPQATVSVRVPAEKLDEALGLIRKLVINPLEDIRTETVTGQDVTGDYVDLQSRLTNLQNTEVQLQRIQDSATKTEDVLNVFNRLTDIRQQIEQIKGKMKFYEESAALSSINVTLLSKAGIAPLSIGGWEPVGVARDAFQTLIDVGKFLIELLIWIVIFFVPIGLVLFFPGRWLWRAIKRRQAKARASTPPLSGYPPYPPPQEAPSQYPEIK